MNSFAITLLVVVGVIKGDDKLSIEVVNKASVSLKNCLEEKLSNIYNTNLIEDVFNNTFSEIFENIVDSHYSFTLYFDSNLNENVDYMIGLFWCGKLMQLRIIEGGEYCACRSTLLECSKRVKQIIPKSPKVNVIELSDEEVENIIQSNLIEDYVNADDGEDCDDKDND
ncbi:uncharacterized protein LOC126899266 [Daktulosphaira vitifoliae]|uniref:uncharacterized protein LOC126899266 n=1 Tax=Daktulosphaira vitifoliae TaxID=58002 RepID=UPI0021A990D2|nr:uncharacterized protein LOC126899266 [Daktulosphaira vitifoliae]